MTRIILLSLLLCGCAHQRPLPKPLGHFLGHTWYCMRDGVPVECPDFGGGE